MKFKIPPLLLHFNFPWNNNWHSSERKEAKNSFQTGFQSTDWNTSRRLRSRHLVAQLNRQPRDDDECACFPERSWRQQLTGQPLPVVMKYNWFIACCAELSCAGYHLISTTSHMWGGLHWLLCACTYIPYCIGMPVYALEVGSQTNTCYSWSGMWYLVIMLLSCKIITAIHSKSCDMSVCLCFYTTDVSAAG